jgi:hypothetical protein
MATIFECELVELRHKERWRFSLWRLLRCGRRCTAGVARIGRVTADLSVLPCPLSWNYVGSKRFEHFTRDCR